MPKSKDAFRTISEVAEWLETPAHVLRFWESKFTQVKPVKRAGGRRYYRPADMLLLGGIKKLLHDDGLTIKGAQKLLREHGVKHVAALSQQLDEDLTEEAAFELDVQPEPVAEPPSTVLSFPNRAEPPIPAPPSLALPEVAAPEDQSPKPQVSDTSPEAAHPEQNEIAQSAQDSTPAPALLEAATPAVEAPAAFGGDALPAFMRRSAPAPQHPKQSADSPLPEETAGTAQKVTIDPTARFEPIEPGAAKDAAASNSAPAQDAPQTPQQPAPDLPSDAKVAPTLDSYTAPAGILAALPEARRISPAIAAEMAPHLSGLRALRDRMRG